MTEPTATPAVAPTPRALAESMPLVQSGARWFWWIAGLVLDALVLGFFFAMGLMAQRGSVRAFYVGGVVYALDALLYLFAGDWMPVGFHVLVLFFIGKSALALRAALQAQPPGSPVAAA
jgi:hypothetical protein